MDATTQSTMGSLLGHDFSNVKVHSGEAAAASARQLGARAYTVGDHIVLGEAVSNLQSRSGRHLLAHELAHVVQQRLGGPAPEGGLDSPSERDAAAAAAALADGRRPPSLVRGTTVGFARQAVHSPADSHDADRAQQIDDYVRAHPELSMVALQQLLNERNALLPLAQEPPAQAANPPTPPLPTASGKPPWSPLQLPGAIPVAAGMIIVPSTSAASSVPPAVLMGPGTAGAAQASVGAGLTEASVGAGLTEAAPAVALLANPITWIVVGVIVVGVAGYLVYRHYHTAPSPGRPERVEAPPLQPGPPISVPGQPREPMSLPAREIGRGPLSLPGGTVSGPVSLPGQSHSSEPRLASGRPQTRDFEPPDRDHFGKVGGEIPENGAERNLAVDSWTREELEHAAEELERSIAARQAEQAQLGETSVGTQGQRVGAAHRDRIDNEIELLRAVRKKLSGS